MRRREIGPWGTIARVIVGVILLVFAAVDDFSAPMLLLGFVVLPGAFMLGLALRGADAPSLRLETPIWHFVNIAIGLVLLRTVPTAAELFLGVSMLVAAWRGIGACEIFAISNWLRGRDDRLGCPVFLPIDALESTRRVPSPTS
jgi:hypothetical protein